MSKERATGGATRARSKKELSRDDARGKVTELSTVLLDPKYDPNEALRLLGELRELGYNRSKVETCLLSRASFQYATTLVKAGNTEELKKRWAVISDNLGLSGWAITKAFEEGEATFENHREKSLDEIQTIICQTFIPPGDR